MDRETIEYQRTVEVGGQTYMIQALSPTKAWSLAVRLSKVIGEPFAAMAQGAGDESKASELLPMAVRALLNNLDENASLGLIKELLLSVEIQGDKKTQITNAVFDIHFQKRLGHMMKLVTHVVEFQFEDFFEAIGDAIATAMEKALTKAA